MALPPATSNLLPPPPPTLPPPPPPSPPNHFLLMTAALKDLTIEVARHWVVNLILRIAMVTWLQAFFENTCRLMLLFQFLFHQCVSSTPGALHFWLRVRFICASVCRCVCLYVYMYVCMNHGCIHACMVHMHVILPESYRE